MLNPRDAFKCGFLSRCVEDRLSPEQMLHSVKQASDLLEKAAILGPLAKAIGAMGGMALDTTRSIGGTALGYGLPLALAAPPILGGAVGYGLAKATDISDTDVAETKDREVIEEYRRQAARLKRQQAVRAFASSQQRPRRALI